MDLAPHISELLYRNDCVIVPEFGGFVAEPRSASIDRERHVIHPPYKALLFNRELQRNDGLLQDHIAQAAALSHAESRETILHTVRDWEHTLEDRRRIELEGVGVLYKGNEGRIRFEQDPHENHLMESFGLRPIYAPPIGKEKEVASAAEETASPRKGTAPLAKAPEVRKEEQREKIAAETPEMERSGQEKGEQGKKPQKDPRPETVKDVGSGEKSTGTASPAAKVRSIGTEKERSLPWSKVAVSVLIILLVGGGWFFYQGGGFHEGRVQWSRWSLFSDSPVKHYEAREKQVATGSWDPASIPLDPSFPPDTDFVKKEIGIGDETKEVVIRRKGAEKKSKKSREIGRSSGSHKGAWHVIGGCFEYEANARELKDQLERKGHRARILDPYKSLHPVAFGSYRSREAAEKALRSVQDQERGAWILRQ